MAMCARMLTTPPPELPNTIVLGVGNDGGALFTPAAQALARTPGGAAALAAVGLFQPDRSPAPLLSSLLAPLQPLAYVLHAPDITLTPDEMQRIREQVRAIGGEQRLPEHLLRAFGDKLFEAVPPSAPISPQLLALVGLRDAASLATTLAQWKTKRLPQLSSTLCVRYPEPGHVDAQAQAALTTLHTLRREQHLLLDAIYLLDPRSPLARTLGEDLQVQMVARAFAALLVAHRHDGHNKRFVEVSQSVGTRVETRVGTNGSTQAGAGARGTYAALSIGVAPVATGPRHPLSRVFWHRGLTSEVGTGDMADCLRQATDLATRLLDDEQARTFAAPFDRTAPPYELLFVVPFTLDDPRFGQVVRELRAWQTAEVPEAGTPLVVSGSGRPAPDTRERYYCLVAYLYGIPDEVVFPSTTTPQTPQTPQMPSSPAAPAPPSRPSSLNRKGGRP